MHEAGTDAGAARAHMAGTGATVKGDCTSRGAHASRKTYRMGRCLLRLLRQPMGAAVAAKLLMADKLVGAAIQACRRQRRGPITTAATVR